MILFLDTSAFIPLVVAEPGSVVARRLWDYATRVVACRLLYVEAAAALAMAYRMGRLDRPAHRLARQALEELHGALDLVEVSRSLVLRAADLAESLGLRGYDAVHCAAADLLADDDLVVASGDSEVLSACSTLGLAVADTSG